MIWKRYRNELILAGALLFAFLAWGYKGAQHRALSIENLQRLKEVAVLDEAVSLQKIWGDKRIAQKLDMVKKAVPPAKIQWHSQGKKATATLQDLLPSEINKVVTKLLNAPVQIQHLKIEKKGDTYTMEFACKW